MKLELTPQEWDILSLWAEKTVKGGHWGNAVLTLGEEEKVLRLIVQKPPVWNITRLELRVVRYWLDNTYPASTREKELVKKIRGLVED